MLFARQLRPDDLDARTDLEEMLWASNLAGIKRFEGQPYWEVESKASYQASAIEGPLRLESVADHSWKVADATAILVDHFPWLDRAEVLESAVLHDKLELITGDISPIDADASGTTTHAFNLDRAAEKACAEREALRSYLRRLRPGVRERQSRLLEDLIDLRSEEARFVKAVDKLASLVFVVQIKAGTELPTAHAQFTLRYSAKGIELFPALEPHFRLLMQLFCERTGHGSLEELGWRASDAASRPIRQVG